ncbi:MAG: hypothetical protein WAV73_05920 [Candidatus Moraniibacteriota bacterium]
MIKIKSFPILCFLISLSFFSAGSAIGATCDLTFNPTPIKAGEKSNLSWDVSGSFTSAKIRCGGWSNNNTDFIDVTDTLKAQSIGSVEWATSSTTYGSGVCDLFFDGDISAHACESNPLEVKPVATCTLKFDPPSVVVGGSSVFSWTVDGNFSSAVMSCDLSGSTGIYDALHATPVGSLDWTPQGSGTERCRLYLNIDSRPLSEQTPTCESNSLVSTFPTGACGSQDKKIIPYGTTLNRQSSGLCPAGKAVKFFYEDSATGSSTWCGEYLWTCEGGGSGYDCVAYAEGKCGSVNGTTVSSLTNTSPNLCADNKVSEFSNQSTKYTWSCSGDTCDSRPKITGLARCEATKNAETPVLTCSFDPEAITAPSSSRLSWNSSGGITSLKTTCSGLVQGVNQVDTVPAGYGDIPFTQSGVAECVFSGYSSSGVLLKTCKANLTVNSGSTDPLITCSFDPDSIKADGTVSHLSMNATNVDKVNATSTGIFGSHTYTDIVHNGGIDYSFTNDSFVGAGSFIYTGYNSAGNTVATCTANLTVTSSNSGTFNCTGSLPTGKTACPGTQTTGLSSATPWTDKGTLAACTTTGGKCEYYASTTCTTWSATLSAAPTSGQSPLTVNLTASTQQVAGGENYIYSNHSCGTGGPAPTNVDGRTFTCVYPSAGTYAPSIRVTAQSTSCANNASAEVTVNGSSFSCTGTLPSGATACADDNTGLTSNLSWQSVGTASTGCTTPRKCEYYIPGTTAYSCTGTLPSGSVMCFDDNTGLTANIGWQSVGTAAASCTTARKCEYYASTTCTTWAATLSAAPTSGQSPLTVNLTASTQQVAGGENYIYSNHSCGTGGPAPTNVNGRTFTCVYPSAGTYAPSIRVTAQSTSCVNNASATVTVSAPSSPCLEPIPPASPAQPMPPRTGSTTCPEDETNVPADTHWYYVGTAASSCTTPRKCEYYIPGTNCDLTANLYATPATGSASLTTRINASVSTSHGPIECSNQDCNGGTISYPYANEECIFNCTYATAGTYNPKVHVADTVCAKDPTTRVVVNIAGTPDCDTNTCTGNSCWDGTKYIPGTKTENCATGIATASPNPATAPGSAYLKWTSTNASGMEAACLSGPVIISRAGSFISDAECKIAGQCTDKGYELKFIANQAGTEICTFYPKNSSDSLSGTPFSVSFKVEAPSTCGNNIVENQEECDYDPSSGQISYVPCPTNKTCKDCKCVSPTAKTDGKCGSAARTYLSTETNWGNYTFCEAGSTDPANPTFPGTGNTTSWRCKSLNGGVDSGECKATRSAVGAPTPDDWSLSISADPALGNPSLKVKVNSGWVNKNNIEMSVTTTKQDCGASGVTPTNNKLSNGTLNNSFECNYTAVGVYYPSVTKKDNAQNEKTATTKVDVVSAPIDDNCAWSSSLNITPQQSSYKVGEEVRAILYVSTGSVSDFVLSNRSCGSASVSPKAISNTSFSCTYSELGSYSISATVKKNAGCAKDIQSGGVIISNNNPSTCEPDNPDCAAHTCSDIVCFDGCVRRQGTKICP